MDYDSSIACASRWPRDVLQRSREGEPMLAIMVLGAASAFRTRSPRARCRRGSRTQAQSNTTIGMLSYVALPYLFKFLWAPFIDRYAAARLWAAVAAGCC